MISSNYKNTFPDCIFLKLHADLVAQSNSLTNQIELKLTIRFGEQQWQEEDITVNFGLRSGKLNLKLSNSKILMETLGMTPQFQKVYEIEKSTEQSQSEAKGWAITLRGGFTTTETKVTTEARKFKDEKYQVYTQVYTKGTEEEMNWMFRLETNQLILQGILQAEKLGNLEVNSKPCQIEATFQIEDEDVHIICTSGLWNQNIDQAKIALLEREFYYRVIKPQLIPDISRAELLYE